MLFARVGDHREIGRAHFYPLGFSSENCREIAHNNRKKDWERTEETTKPPKAGAHWPDPPFGRGYRTTATICGRRISVYCRATSCGPMLQRPIPAAWSGIQLPCVGRRESLAPLSPKTAETRDGSVPAKHLAAAPPSVR